MPRRVPSNLTEEARQVVDQLVAARFAAGLTQQQVADRMGAAQTQVSDLERGSRKNGPSATVLLRYARAVGLDQLILTENKELS